MPPKKAPTARKVQTSKKTPETKTQGDLTDFVIVENKVENSVNVSGSSVEGSGESFSNHPEFEGVRVDCEGNWEKNSDSNICRMLAIDCSTKSGVSVMSYDKTKEVATLQALSMIMIETKGKTEGSICNEYYQQIIKMLDLYKPDFVAIEHFFFNKKTCNAAALNLLLRAAIFMGCDVKSTPYNLFSSFDWKKLILKKVTISKADRKVMKNPNKQMVQHALKEHFGLEFPAKMASHKSKQLIVFKDDLIDSCGQNIYQITKNFSPKDLKIIDLTKGNVSYI